MKYHYKRINYEQLDRTQKVEGGKVVINKNEWTMMCDYLLFLESALYQATGKTFGSIPDEMVKFLGKEKVKQFYGVDE